jgi:response regulator NasT
LLDIRMEGLSGFDVAETLRDVYRIPFMFLSAFSDAATSAKVAELGALDYLVKPLDVGQIVPSVDAAFARLAHGDAPAAPVRTESPVPSAAIADPVPLAVGALMHRLSLSRLDAWRHLQRLAADSQLAVPVQAERLLAAIEELARTTA